MPRVPKEKQEKTLNRMRGSRLRDQAFIRQLIKDKLAWAKEELQKGHTSVKSLKESIAKIEAQMGKLEGAIAVLVSLDEAKATDNKEE